MWDEIADLKPRKITHIVMGFKLRLHLSFSAWYCVKIPGQLGRGKCDECGYQWELIQFYICDWKGSF